MSRPDHGPWQSAAIGDVCSVVNGGTPKTGVLEYWGGQHQWITPAEMGKRRIPYIGQTERTITDQGLRNSSARLLPPHSVILSSRAPIGHLAINTEPMATNQGCKGLVPGCRTDYKFVYYYLVSIVELLNELGTGTTFKELSGGKLKKLPIPVPPLPRTPGSCSAPTTTWRSSALRRCRRRIAWATSPAFAMASTTQSKARGKPFASSASRTSKITSGSPLTISTG
jgi:hypothetical protein